MIAHVLLIVAMCAVTSGHQGQWGPGPSTAPTRFDRRPGEDIDWRTVDERGLAKSLKECKTLGRPAFVYFHKDSCSACVKLMNIFLHSSRITEESKKFVMIKVLQSSHPPTGKNAKMYRPDGGYTPRILFYDVAAEFVPTLYNALGNANFKYFYFSEDQILESMWRAIAPKPSDKKTEL